MQIINEDDDVKLRELIKEIYKFAKQRNEPFTSSEAFEHVKEADDVTAASNATRTLYIEGKLARKKIDGVRYSYVLIENAPEDYETVSGINPVAFEAKPEPEPEPEPCKTTSSVSETKRPAKKTELEIGNPLEIKVGEALKLPEHFSLRLETPGGITITITAGV